MKRKLTLVLVIAMVLMTAVALSSCEALIDLLPGNGNDDPPVTVDPGKDPADDTVKDPEPPVVRTTVTEEEFDVAFKETNFTAIMKVTATRSDESVSQTGIIEMSGDVLHMVLAPTEVSEEQETYYVTQNGTKYCLEDRDEATGVFYATAGVNTTITSLGNVVAGGAPMNVPFGQFTYDEEKGTYSFSAGNGSLVLWFEDGKLVKSEFRAAQTVTDSEGNTVVMLQETTAEISKIGTTEIEVPIFVVK